MCPSILPSVLVFLSISQPDWSRQMAAHQEPEYTLRGFSTDAKSFLTIIIIINIMINMCSNPHVKHLNELHVTEHNFSILLYISAAFDSDSHLFCCSWAMLLLHPLS